MVIPAFLRRRQEENERNFRIHPTEAEQQPLCSPNCRQPHTVTAYHTRSWNERVLFSSTDFHSVPRSVDYGSHAGNVSGAAIYTTAERDHWLLRRVTDDAYFVGDQPCADHADVVSDTLLDVLWVSDVTLAYDQDLSLYLAGEIFNRVLTRKKHLCRYVFHCMSDVQKC